MRHESNAGSTDPKFCCTVSFRVVAYNRRQSEKIENQKKLDRERLNGYDLLSITMEEGEN